MASSTTSWLRGSSIGAGSFGSVHLAVDPSTGLLFAVKSVSLTSSSPASIHSLENEIKILASLRSPYIVSYLGHDTAGDSRNLHLEYMPGGAVADSTAKGRPLDEPRVRAYARCVARALRYLHDVAGVVHCDVKGRNVLLRRDRRAAKLADFGAAVRLSSTPGGARGTPLWMAPEVARGEPPSPAADVWWLGCTVIEMATGARPWGNDLATKDAAGALLEIAYGDGAPELPERLSDAGRDFLDKCLRRDARERWTAEQLLRHPFLSEEEGKVAEPSPRGVLECAEVESDDDGEGSDGEEGWEAAARERVKELGSGGGALGWGGDEGWEVVRSSQEEKLMAEMEEEEEMAMNGIECAASCCCCCCCRCREEQKIKLTVLLLIKYIVQCFFCHLCLFDINKPGTGRPRIPQDTGLITRYESCYLIYLK